MIDITIRDVSGCNHAQLQIEPGKITLIGGNNAAAKSSIARAVGAVAAGCKMPDGDDQTKAIKYVKRGAKEGVASITMSDKTNRIIHWSDGKVKMTGTAESIGMSAAGLQRFTGQTVDKRAQILSKALNSSPTEQDLEQELVTELGKERALELLPAMWRTISSTTFDTSLKQYEDDGKHLKRVWQEHTGMPKWGMLTAVNWKPEGWEPEIDNTTVQQVQEQFDAAKAAYEEALKTAAATDAQLDELRQKTAKLSTLQKELADIKERASFKTQDLATAQALLSTLPQADQPEVLKCLDCPCEFIIEGGKVVRATKLSDDVLKSRADALAVQLKRVLDLKAEIAQLDTEHREHYAAVKSAEEAAAKLQKLLTEQKKAVKKGDDPDSAAQKLHFAQVNLECRVSKQKADETHLRIIENVKIQDILSPDGLRRKKLAAALDVFKKDYLEPICKSAAAADKAWQQVIITPELKAMLGETEYAQCSASEQFRVDVTIQCALALKEQQPFVVIDPDEWLDDFCCAGLLSMLVGQKITALCTMTASKPSEVPDLQRKGVGRNYWAAGGKLAEAKVPA